MLLIGIIIGSTAGYFGNLIVTQPILTDLQNRLQTLEEDYDSLDANFNELSADKTNLEQQLETLQDAYAGLQAENLALRHQLCV